MPSHCFSVLTSYLLIDLTLDIVAELAQRGDALHLLGFDFKTEVAFYDDHNVYEVETVDARQ